AALVSVERGSDEGPELVKHPGRGEEDGADDGELEPDDLQGVGGVEDEDMGREAGSGEGLRSGLLDEVPERVGEGEAEAESDGDACECADEAGAELSEVLDEGHAEEIFGHGGPRVVMGVPRCGGAGSWGLAVGRFRTRELLNYSAVAGERTVDPSREERDE